MALHHSGGGGVHPSGLLTFTSLHGHGCHKLKGPFLRRAVQFTSGLAHGAVFCLKAWAVGNGANSYHEEELWGGHTRGSPSVGRLPMCVAEALLLLLFSNLDCYYNKSSQVVLGSSA